MSVESVEVKVDLDFDLKTYQAEWRRTSRERMLPFAERGEAARKLGSVPMVPPMEIIDHPDLLGKAWGWDRILPYNDRFPYGWSQYKKYLEKYYRYNTPTALAHQTEANNVAGNHILDEDDGNGLAAYADLCIKTEDELMTYVNRRPGIFAVDEGNLSNKITSCACQIKNSKCCEFPVATIALKCVKMEADLLLEIILTGAATPRTMEMSNKIRQCALSFMTYKGTEHMAAAAVMMGAMTEANLMYELVKSGKHKEESSAYLWSYTIREWTLEALSRICSECCVIEECISNGLPITMDKTAAELEPEKNLSKEDGSLDKQNEKQSNKLWELLKSPFSRDHRSTSQGTKGILNIGCFGGQAPGASSS